MLSRVNLPGAWMWSAWQPDRGMAFNSYLFERDGGCVAVDPLPLDAESLEQIEQLGGIGTIVITNCDHRRAAETIRERFGARLVDGETQPHGTQLFEGAFAVALPGGKTPGEIALHFPQFKAALVGDALIGTPAGALSVLPAEKLADRDRFVYSLRRLWGLELETLLLCDGQPIFNGADAVIGALLEREGGPAIHRVNLDELEYVVTRPGKYACEDAEVGLPIGARRLGYRVARIPPGKAYCPLHWHVRSEEFFYVIEGRPSIRTGEVTFACRPGDFIAFPSGDAGVHQVINESDAPALVMLAGMEEVEIGLEACFYPDSDKVGLYTTAGRIRMVKASPNLDYYDGE